MAQTKNVPYTDFLFVSNNHD